MSDKATVTATATNSKAKPSSSQPRRTNASPPSASPLVAQMSFLQRTVGNHEVGRLLESGVIQAKLTVSQPGDIHELEADRVAAGIMRMPAPGGEARTKTVSPDHEPPRIQRMCTECEEEEALHRQPGPGADGATGVAPTVQSRISSITSGGGRPMGESAQAFFEPRFGQDFSDVRIHTDGNAVETARAVNARAYTLGRNIVFNAGEYQPNTDGGRLLLAHELTHVVQQNGGATVQRQPKAPDPAAEREAAVKEAEGIIACTTDQIEAQSDAEDKFKLKSKKRKDTGFALAQGVRDKNRAQKAGKLSAELQHEIGVKVRFFRGEAKAAYLRTITAVVSTVAEPEQVSDILTECTAAPAKEQKPQDRPDIPCDIAQSEYLLEDESGSANSRCMNIKTDPEYQNLFDRNIKNAVGYAVPGTTWDNVDYDSFKVMLVNYHNGKSEYFQLNSVGNFHYARSDQASIIRDHKYVKRSTGLIYPVFEDQMYLNEHLTPRILSLKNGLKFQAKELKDLYTLLQAGGTFAAILGLYGLGVESFKASIYAFRRGGPVKLPGRPLPGVGVKPAAARQTFVDSVFSDLGGPKKGFKIQIVDDSTVIETPSSVSNIGIATRHAGGALTDPGAKRIYVHQSLVDTNGLVRKWGAPLDLKQVTAHELGHGINGGGSCAMASRTGADLPGLSATQRTGLLDDAVHISRSSRMPGERVRLEDLKLPKDYEPPKP